MMYKVVFHPEAEKEFLSLDNRVRLLVSKQLIKISASPLLGEGLGNRHGYDLSGYRKMYVDNKRVRIVYSIHEDRIEVQIIAIGKRDDFEVYKVARNRVSQMTGDNSHEV